MIKRSRKRKETKTKIKQKGEEMGVMHAYKKIMKKKKMRRTIKQKTIESDCVV